MKIGYARISTADQKFELQIDALKQVGCDKIYKEIVSGAKTERYGLKQALDFARPHDTLVVWKLDRLGRSIHDLINIIKKLNDQQIGFQSLQENIDTTTNGGKLVFHIFSALAEFERGLIVERTKAGLKAARARGRLGGRPRSLSKSQVRRMIEIYHDGKTTVAEICKIYSISRPTFYNYLNKKR